LVVLLKLDFIIKEVTNTAFRPSFYETLQRGLVMEMVEYCNADPNLQRIYFPIHRSLHPFGLHGEVVRNEWNDQTEVTPLDIAIRYNQIDIVNFLIQRGVPYSNALQLATIHRIYSKEGEPLIKSLLQYSKIDITLKEGIGNDLFFIACSCGLYSTLQYLLRSYGYTITGVLGPRVLSCFVSAVFNGDIETMDTLLNFFRDKYHEVILEATAYYGNWEIFRRVLDPKELIKKYRSQWPTIMACC